MSASDQKTSVLMTTLYLLQAKVSVIPIHLEEQFKGFYSNLFTVPKPNRGPILDLKSWNNFFCEPKLQMESTRSFFASLRLGGFMASVDMPIYISSSSPHINACFAVWDQHLSYVVPTFGPPFCRTSVCKSSRPSFDSTTNQGVHVTGYLDDLHLKDLSATSLLTPRAANA